MKKRSIFLSLSIAIMLATSPTKAQEVTQHSLDSLAVAMRQDIKQALSSAKKYTNGSVRSFQATLDENKKTTELKLNEQDQDIMLAKNNAASALDTSKAAIVAQRNLDTLAVKLDNRVKNFDESYTKYAREITAAKSSIKKNAVWFWIIGLGALAALVLSVVALIVAKGKKEQKKVLEKKVVKEPQIPSHGNGHEIHEVKKSVVYPDNYKNEEIKEIKQEEEDSGTTRSIMD